MPAMVCTADELLGWKDFPKGLKVLLIESDACSAVEMRLKLEEMDYIGKKLMNFFSFLSSFDKISFLVKYVLGIKISLIFTYSG